MMKLMTTLTCTALWLAACGGEDAAGTPPNPTAEGDAGQPPGTPPPPSYPPIEDECDQTKTPSENACVLHEQLGVFVSASKGADTNDGTRTRPYATLAKGIEAAKQSKRRVYACAEAYTGTTLVLEDGVAIFANLLCAQPEWSVSPATRAVLAVTAPIGARASAIRAETRIEGLELVAAAATAPGGSSIGLIATDSPGLHFVGSRIAAQNGGNGVDGADGVQLSGGFDGQVGAAPVWCSVNPAGSVTPYTCLGARTATGGSGTCTGGGVEIAANPGGEGGAAAPHVFTSGVYVRGRASGGCAPGATCYALNGSGLPVSGTPATAVGAHAFYDDTNYATPNHMTISRAGEPGPMGSDGANAPTGSLTIDGYVPTNGTMGGDGEGGQGGGGGAAGRPMTGNYPQATGPGGGGGGSGGCPGLAGGFGTGGGASIAVLVQGGGLRFERSIVAAGRGGMGGRGSVGSAPTPGGLAGTGGLLAASAGGPGGAAGWSGHGSSGPSFGIAWSGTQPTVSADSTVTVAAAREGQPALSGNGKTVPAMAPGASAAVQAF